MSLGWGFESEGVVGAVGRCREVERWGCSKV